MSKFKSLLEAHHAEVDNQSPVAVVTDSMSEVVTQRSQADELPANSSIVSTSSTAPVAPKRMAPVWEPPMKWLLTAVGVIVVILVLHYARLMLFGWGDTNWTPPVADKTSEVNRSK